MIRILVDKHVLGDIAEETGLMVQSITEIGPMYGPRNVLELWVSVGGGAKLIFYAYPDAPLARGQKLPPSVETLSPFKTGSSFRNIIEDPVFGESEVVDAA